MEGKFPLRKARSFTEVINDSIAFAKRYIKPVGYVILVLVVPIYLLGSFLYIITVSSVLDFGHAQAGNLLNLKKLAGGSILGALVLIVGHMMLTAVFVSAVVSIESSETGDIESKDIFDRLKTSIPRLLRFYFLSLVIGCIIVGLMAMVIAALSSISANGLIGLLMFALVIALIYLAICLAFLPIIYIREECSLGEAISRSFYLIKGNWWWTFLILFVGGMIGGIGAIVFTLPYTVIVTVKTFTTIRTGHTSFDMSLLDRVALALSHFGSIISASVVIIVSLIQYYSLVEKKDGVDLMQQIDNIGIDETPMI